MSSLLLTDVRIVNEETVTEGDLLVKDGRIDTIGGDLAGRGADRVIKGNGRWLLPGLIDDQVHFREPGMEHKADIATESAAAVAGGVTSFFEMPNTKPPTLSAAALEDKCHRAEGRARANYGFFFGAGRDNMDALMQLDPRSTPRSVSSVSPGASRYSRSSRTNRKLTRGRRWPPRGRRRRLRVPPVPRPR